MIERIRVQDKATKHRFTIVASRFDPEIYEKLDEPATRPDGTPLPPKHHVPKGTRTTAQTSGRTARKRAARRPSNASSQSPTPPAASDQSGQTAESEKENS